jgi:hypothetical protein
MTTKPHAEAVAPMSVAWRWKEYSGFARSPVTRYHEEFPTHADAAMPLYLAPPSLYQSDLQELCILFGWQGGTIHQVKAEITKRSADLTAALAANAAQAETIRQLQARIDKLVAALTDMRSGWRYIRESHGDLYGVGWDRCEESATAALTTGAAK